MLKLQVIEGNATGTEIPVGDELVIGRLGPEEGRLGDDPELSRQHARVTRAGEGYVVEDLGSMNGTFVNGNRLAGPHELADGDQIELGGTRLVTQLERAAAPPPPPPPAPAPEIGATRIAPVPEGPPTGPPPAPAPAPPGDTFVQPSEPPAPAGPPPAAGPPSAGPPPAPDLPPPQGRPQETVTPPPVGPATPPPEGRPQDTVTPAPAPPTGEPADLPPPEGPPQDTVTPAPTPVEEPPRPQDTEVPPKEPEQEPRPPVSLRVEIDVDAGEATIELDEGGDSVRLRQQDGRWVLGPEAS